MSRKSLISVIGPTAIGKTSLSIKIAQQFKTEILSCDSRQFYKEMNIGTAVPSKTELDQVPHHFIQHLSILDTYNVGKFESDAMHKLEELFAKHDTLILTGGSGLYEKAVLNGLDNFPAIDPAIRRELNKELSENGIQGLQSELQNLDPKYYASIDVNNPHRLIRALEICRGTNKSFSSFLNAKQKPRNFKSIKIGLTAERETIYDRINQRVDAMVEAGLVEEVKSLHAYKHLNALKTVGYTEIFEYLEAKISLQDAVSELKKNTRRFAKRQLTWYRKQEDITWFNYDVDPQKVIEYISSVTP